MNRKEPTTLIGESYLLREEDFKRLEKEFEENKTIEKDPNWKSLIKKAYVYSDPA